MDTRRRQKIIVTTVIALLLLGVLLVALEWQDVRRIVSEADWELSLISLLFIVVTYLCLSYGFVVVSRIFDIKMRLRQLLGIGYVSTTLNNVLAFLGAAGHSLRLALMKRQEVKAGQVLASSLFHSHLHNLGMFCLLDIGLVFLAIHHSVHGSTAIGVALASGLLIILFIIATTIIFMRSLRRVVLRLLSRAIRLLVRKDVTSFLDSFDQAMVLGVKALGKHYLLSALLILLIAAEWVSTIVAMWFCFDALGNPISLGILITGFAVGISAGNLSMVPGGFGVQEASMAGIYALLGVSFEQAVLASILFRVVYDFIPFLVSLFFYRRLLHLPLPTGK